jgi:hypothetical protein
MMNKQRTQGVATLWGRTTKALGRWLAGMITLPDDPRCAQNKRAEWNDYPHFPPY